MNIQESKESSETTPKRVLLIQLGTLLLLFILNLGVKFILDSSPPTAAHLLVRGKWQLLEQQSTPADILILGDSSSAFGIDPHRLEEKTGLKVLNLATVGQLLTINDAWMLNRYIQLIGSPRVVVVMRYWPYWEKLGPSPLLMSSIPMKWAFWERLKPGTLMTNRQMWQFFLGRYLPIYSKNVNFQILLRQWRKGLRLKGLTERGGVIIANEDTTPFSRGALNMSDRLENPRPFSISPANVLALESLQETCIANGITLVLANPAIYEDDAKHPNYRAYQAEVFQVLGAYTGPAKQTMMLLADPSIFGSDKMLDSLHLNSQGAAEYTDRLYNDLATASGAPQKQPNVNTP